MSEEINKDYLIDWIDRPPSNTDLNVINYITLLQQKVEQLENIIDVKKYDYDYLKTLFSKSSKEEVLKAYTYKCEQLEKVTEARNEFEMKSMQLENIRKEAIEYIKEDMYVEPNELYGLVDGEHLLNILNKGSYKDVKD